MGLRCCRPRRSRVGDVVMYLVLFAVGLLITAAGLVTIGFGIPINAFSLGNTLIISGTVAVVGGLVLIGLAAAIRQLNRISVALNSRPVARPRCRLPRTLLPPAAAEPVADTLVPPTARIPQAPVRTPSQAPAPAAPRQAVEPHFPAASSESASGPLDWLRSKPKPASDTPPIAGEPPVMDIADEAPLSPRAPQRPMFSPPPAAPSPSIEPPAEPRAWMPPSRGNGTHEAPHKEPSFKEPRSDFPPISAPRSEQVARTNAPDRARDLHGCRQPAGKDAGLFDVVWPDARSKADAGRRACSTRVSATEVRGPSRRRSVCARSRAPRSARNPPLCRARRRDPQVRGDRRHGLHALRRRLDRGRAAAGHRAVRVGRRAPRAPGEKRLTLWRRRTCKRRLLFAAGFLFFASHFCGVA